MGSDSLPYPAGAPTPASLPVLLGKPGGGSSPTVKIILFFFSQDLIYDALGAIGTYPCKSEGIAGSQRVQGDDCGKAALQIILPSQYPRHICPGRLLDVHHGAVYLQEISGKGRVGFRVHTPSEKFDILIQYMYLNP